jgi:hypothetical protein
LRCYRSSLRLVTSLFTYETICVLYNLNTNLPDDGGGASFGHPAD